MGSRKYPPVLDGQVVHPRMKGYRMACCDCGLVHVIDFEVVKAGREDAQGYFTTTRPKERGLRVQMIARRDNRATAQIRRRKRGLPR